MKLQYDFELVTMGDEIMAIPITKDDESFNGVVRLNETGAEIFRLLQAGMGKKQIVDDLVKLHMVDWQTMSDYYDEFVIPFVEKGILK